MLLKMDEYPFHQITETFAGVGGSDPQWNDGHYVCGADAAGRVSFTSNVRLYQNNDVLDGFVCIRHNGRQYNIRLSRRLRTDMETIGVGPLRLEILEPMTTVRLVLDDNDFGISMDVVCHTVGVPYMGPIEVTRPDGRLLSERATYELAGRCEGWVQVGADRCELTGGSFFRNHSWGNQAGRGGPRIYGAPVPRHRVPGVRQWVLFNMPGYSGFYFSDPSGRPASGRGSILLADRAVPVQLEHSELSFYEGGRRVKAGTFSLVDENDQRWTYEFEDLGWVYCQGGGYFGGFNDRLGQGVYRGEYHVEGEVWDVSHPTALRDQAGKVFEFDHAWAESFVRLRRGDETGLAHFECVVIEPAEEPAE